MQFVLHFLPIESEIQRQWRRFKKSGGLVKEKTKNTLRPCTMCDKTCLYLCPTTNVLDKVLRQEGCIFFNEANPLPISLLSQQETSEMGTDRRGGTYKYWQFF